MTSDERIKLVDDIRRSAEMRERIVARATKDCHFDIAAAWEELYELDRSIDQRVVKARIKNY